MTFVAIFLIIVGLGIAGIWAIDIAGGKFANRGKFFQWREGEALLWPHLLAEYLTALALVAAGTGLLLQAAWSIPLAWLALGALVYTAINSSGWVLADRSRLSYGIPMWVSLFGALVCLIWLIPYSVKPVQDKKTLIEETTLLLEPELFDLTETQQPEQDANVIPRGFGYVHEVIPDARYDIRYHGDDNFLGVPVDGYLEPVAILTMEALKALRNAADDFRSHGYGIIVFDGYRPQKAVDHFVRWAREIGDTLTKRTYYPDVNKAHLFSLGYIASRSGHSRGSTVDLTLFDLQTGQEIDMGTGFDFFGPLSAHDSDQVTPEQLANRNFLRRIMVKHGFIPYPEEWWHYTLQNEPYPEKYFDFDVF